MNKSEDIILVSQIVLLGNKGAYRSLVDKYQQPLRRFFMLHTNNSYVSDDLSQDTFIKVWQKLPSFKGISSFSTWLYAVAYNVLKDYYRRNYYSDDISENTAAVFELSDSIDKRYDIAKAINSLGKEEKSCVILYYIQDMSISKISMITSMPKGTIKSHLSRARAKIESFLKTEGYGER